MCLGEHITLAKVFSKAPVVGLHQRTYDGPHRLALGLGERDGDAAAVGVSLGDVLGALQAARKRLEERRATLSRPRWSRKSVSKSLSRRLETDPMKSMRWPVSGVELEHLWEDVHRLPAERPARHGVGHDRAEVAG